MTGTSQGELTKVIIPDKFVAAMCPLDWSDKDADSFCIVKGFKGGKAIRGNQHITVELAEFVWFSGINCPALSENSSIQECIFNTDVSEGCFNQRHSPAAVLCYEGEFIRFLKAMNNC